MIGLFTVLLAIVSPAMAQENPAFNSKNCPPVCIQGTPEHDKWWCESKTIQSDCEAKDKVNCQWVDSQCKAK